MGNISWLALLMTRLLLAHCVSVSLSLVLVLNAVPSCRIILYATRKYFRPAYIHAHALITHARFYSLCPFCGSLIFDMPSVTISLLCTDCLNLSCAELLTAGISLYVQSEVVIVVLIPISIPISRLYFFVSPTLF